MNLYFQEGGTINPDKIWEKYKDNLIEKLSKDSSFNKEGQTEILKLPNDFINADISSQKYLEWIVGSYVNNGINLYEDLLSRVKPSLERYNYLLNSNILSIGNSAEPWTNEKDINNYCGLSGCTIIKKGKYGEKPGLESLLDKYPEIEDIKDIKDVEKFNALAFESEDATIYTPKTVEESCHYGRGTKWCTASIKGENMFDEYNRKAQLYIIVPKYPKYKREKYQIHYETDSYMNEKDKPVDIKDLVSRFPILKKTIKTINSAIKIGDIDLIKYIHEELDLQTNQESSYYAIKTGDIKIIKYVHENCNAQLDEYTFNDAIKTRDIDIIKYVHEDLHVQAGKNTLNDSIRTGDIKIIKYVHEKCNSQPDENTFYYSIQTGNIHILQYVHENCKAPHEYTLNTSIKTRDLGIIKYVHKQMNAQPDNFSLKYAIYTRNIDIIKYVFDEIGINVHSIINISYVDDVDDVDDDEIKNLVSEYILYLKNLKEKNLEQNYKLKPNKYRSTCLELNVTTLRDILNEIDIKKINTKDIKTLSKSEICWFLDEDHETSKVVFKDKLNL